MIPSIINDTIVEIKNPNIPHNGAKTICRSCNLSAHFIDDGTHQYWQHDIPSRHPVVHTGWATEITSVVDSSIIGMLKFVGVKLT